MQTTGTKIIGIDEVGRGCGSGPIMACALIFLDEGYKSYPFKDSKLLSHEQRIEIVRMLKLWKEEEKVDWSITSATAEAVDQHGIQYCNIQAIRRAAHNVATLHAFDRIIADGNLKLSGISVNNIEIAIHSIIKADRDFAEVSAASIVAKVTRDLYMAQLDSHYPQYNWKHNKGYLTAEHRVAIAAHGLSPHHRRSFCKNIKLLGV